jgi:beta-galactosidase
LPAVINFGTGDAKQSFGVLDSLRPDGPHMSGEYWAGWFDHWGEKRERLDAGQQASDLHWMLERNASVNVYMFHGGTNFGFWNGANSSETVPYQPTTTSYDYEAALDEAGRPTPKYFAFREAIARTLGNDPPDVPAAPLTIDVPEFSLDRCAALIDAAAPPIESDFPLPMEEIGQQSGFLLYRAIVEGPFDALLQVDEVRDYAVVMLDDAIAGRLDRRSMTSSVRIASRQPYAKLEILVENCGRINYGPGLRFEQKGITRRVTLGARELRGWQLFALPLDDLRTLRFGAGTSSKPAFYRGSFFVERPESTFLDVRELGKGVLWVNGRNAGRFWNIGPQRALYVPGSWLQPGENEAVAFDLFPHEQVPRLRGVSERES